MKKIFWVLTLSVFLVVPITLCHTKNRISIRIKNNSGHHTNKITLEFTGGRETIPDLPPGNENYLKIAPSGESALWLCYRDRGSIYKKKIDIYIEPGYTGNVTISIQDKGVVLWDSTIEP